MKQAVLFHAGVYSLDTIKKAAYRFADVAVIDICPNGDNIECVVECPANLALVEVERVAAAFKVEVLDQDLRATIAAETAAIRNAVLAYAFSKTNLQSSE